MGELGRVSDLSVYELRSDDGLSWQLFPFAAWKISKFAKEYDSDANTELMIAHVKNAFVVSPRGNQQIIVALDGETIVGHVFVTMEYWFGTPFATVVQYELDHAIPHELVNVAMARIEEWSNERHAAFLQCLARNETVARAFSTFRGFVKNRIIMRKPLSTAVADPEETA